MQLILNGVAKFSHTGSMPFSVGISMYIQGHDQLKLKEEVHEIDVDFGDGAGWQDVTQLWFEMVDSGSQPILEQQLPHTYTAAGSYSVHCRVTFADGEVLTSPEAGQQEYTVVVQPAS